MNPIESPDTARNDAHEAITLKQTPLRKRPKLIDLSEDDILMLKVSGMFWEFYPEGA